MAITLPIENQTWPLMRAVVKQRWATGSGATPWTSGGGWEVLPYEGQAPSGSGYRVLDFDRACLPMIGTARFLFHFGRIDGKIYGPDSTTTEAATSGSGAAAGNVATAVRDLTGYEVRIQGARVTTDGSDPEWRTVWWGEVQTQDDTGWPAADVPAGDRVYHCTDGLARITRWALDRHGFRSTSGSSAVEYGNVRGHPGYNVGRARDSRAAANRWSGGDVWSPDAAGSVIPPVAAYFHGYPGSADCTTWTDQQAIENALAACRRPGEPLFGIIGSAGDWNGSAQEVEQLKGASAWEVRDGDNCMDLLTRILRRERGKGLAFLDWNDDSGNPTGPLTVFVRVWAQNSAAITYQDPTASQVTIAGVSGGSRIELVDLIGDHRCVDEAFHLGDKDQFGLDALETVGEPIEVLVTLSYRDGMAGSAGSEEGRSMRRRWSAADQTAFRAITDANKRIAERWSTVYQLHGLPYGWDCMAGNGDNGELLRCDYRCGEDPAGTVGGVNNGKIIAPSGTDLPFTSPVLLRVLDDLPLYEGYDYRAASNIRWDAGAERGDPQRRPVLGLIRITANKFLKWEQETRANLNARIDGQDVLIYNQAGSGNGLRVFSDPTLSHLGAIPTIGYYTALALTVAIQLPHRVRFRTGMPDADPNCKRKATIERPDHHLWLAHPGAIWDVDDATGSNVLGHTPRRAAVAGSPSSPGILRDDRSALARQHYLTWSWYGTPRRTATWAIRDCGLLGSFLAFDGTTIPADGGSPSPMPYATLGQTVELMRANGEVHVLNTPVTRIAYDHGRGVTTWSTDWNELDRA
ncbi:hypothetical protein [Methylibium sp.]|uniref:hypothetical protein n=1 Tax=Methylibium sp. TaxID=2067992 RepID=UPI00180DEB4D|nr:hypothetical protein [Methylibium sp.]MBA3588514.1 hypothetical protein [Methylibium sp.]